MKRLLLTLLTLAFTLGLIAAERSQDEAALIAAQFINAGGTAIDGAAPARKISPASLRLAYRADKAYYIFNQAQGGYVVVSADDRAEDVLLYAENGSFNLETINPNLRWWLERYEKQMSHIDEVDQDAQAAYKAARAAVQTTAIAPLLTNDNGVVITWNQTAPYYNLCPMDALDNTRCLTGCVATAASQIMYKWRWPERGTGTHSYTWYDYLDEDYDTYQTSTLSFDYDNTPFDWNNMLPSYDNASSNAAQKNAVATLMYAVGVACDMGYGGNTIGGSGSYTDWMGKGFEDHLGYTYERMISSMSQRRYEEDVTGEPCRAHDALWNVSFTDFATYFDADLEAGRPILMGGEGRSGGHEFVCDGRNTYGKYHINWGWEGSDNCYVSLSAVQTGTGRNDSDFSDYIEALIGLQPNNIAPVAVTGVTLSPTEATININEKLSLTALIAPSDATNKTVTWSSSEPTVASVNNGLVKGLSAGTTVITVTTADGGFSAEAVITVTNQAVISNAFERITATEALEDDMQILIVNEEAAVALGQYNSNKYFETAAVTITDNTITLEDENNTDVAILTLESNGNYWHLLNGDNYLYCASTGKKNYLSEEASLDSESRAEWAISITNGVATIVSQTNASDRTSLMYNSTQPRFACYKGTQQEVAIFGRTKTVPAPSTSLEAVNNTPQASKVLINGNVFILRDGKLYNLQGLLIQ